MAGYNPKGYRIIWAFPEPGGDLARSGSLRILRREAQRRVERFHQLKFLASFHQKLGAQGIELPFLC